jgi:hypothetical protein
MMVCLVYILQSTGKLRVKCGLGLGLDRKSIWKEEMKKDLRGEYKESIKSSNIGTMIHVSLSSTINLGITIWILE